MAGLIDSLRSGAWVIAARMRLVAGLILFRLAGRDKHLRQASQRFRRL